MIHYVKLSWRKIEKETHYIIGYDRKLYTGESGRNETVKCKTSGKVYLKYLILN